MVNTRKAKYNPAIKILLPFLKDKECAKEIESLLKELGYFPKIKGSVSKEVKSKSGVIVALILPKGKFKSSESVIMKLRIINNSETFIYLNRAFRPKIFYKTLNGGRAVPMTRHGQRWYSPNRFGYFSPPGGMPFRIKPGKYYSEKIYLSQIFDLTLTSDYLISCDINYYIKENEEQKKQILKIENLPLTIK